MNKINPQKLLNSKWIAVSPTNKKKHFNVFEIELDKENLVVSWAIEAVMTKRCIAINWHDLKDNNWLHGWK